MKTNKSQPDNGTIHQFEVFFDGDCPLCHREINMIRRKDKSGKLLLTDISDEAFVPTDRSLEQLMKEIHGRFPDGSYVTGVEVFRQIYDRLGFGLFVSPTRLPIIRNVFNLAYLAFAKLRFSTAMRRMKRASCRLSTDGEISGIKCDQVKNLAGHSTPKI